MPPTNDDDLRDDKEDAGGNALPIILVIIAIAVGVFAIASGIGAIKSTQSTPPPPTVSTCTNSCWGFVKLECPGDRYMDVCFGFWGCGNPITNHPCGTNN